MGQSAMRTFSECYATLMVEGGLEPEELEGLWHEWLWNTPCNKPPACGDLNTNQVSTSPALHSSEHKFLTM